MRAPAFLARAALALAFAVLAVRGDPLAALPNDAYIHVSFDTTTTFLRTFTVRIDAGSYAESYPKCRTNVMYTCSAWTRSYRTLAEELADRSNGYGKFVAISGGEIYTVAAYKAYIENLAGTSGARVWTVYGVPAPGVIDSGWFGSVASHKLVGLCLVDYWGDYTVKYRVRPNWADAVSYAGVPLYSGVGPDNLNRCGKMRAIQDSAYSEPGCPITVDYALWDRLLDCASYSLYRSETRNPVYGKKGYFFKPDGGAFGNERGTCYKYRETAFLDDPGFRWCKDAGFTITGQLDFGTNPSPPSQLYEKATVAFVGADLAVNATLTRAYAYDKVRRSYQLTPQTMASVKHESTFTNAGTCGATIPLLGVRVWDGRACFTVANPFDGSAFPRFTGYSSPLEALGEGGGRIWYNVPK